MYDEPIRVMTLEGTGIPIKNRKREIDLYFSSKDQERAL